MGLSYGEKPRNRPPAYAGRHIENIRTTFMQGGYRGSGLVQVALSRRVGGGTAEGHQHRKLDANQ